MKYYIETLYIQGVFNVFNNLSVRIQGVFNVFITLSVRISRIVYLMVV